MDQFHPIYYSTAVALCPSSESSGLLWCRSPPNGRSWDGTGLPGWSHAPEKNHRSDLPFAIQTWQWMISSTCTGWWFQLLWKTLVSWDYYSQDMEKKCSKPPTSADEFAEELTLFLWNLRWLGGNSMQHLRSLLKQTATQSIPSHVVYWFILIRTAISNVVASFNFWVHNHGQFLL